MTITSDLVESFLKCPTRCFLRSREETGTADAYTDWVRIRSDFFRDQAAKRLAAEILPNRCVNGTPPIGVRWARWQLAIGFLARHQSLESFCHALERIPSSGQTQTVQFVPIRFVASNKVSRDDKLLLAFDAGVASGMLSRQIALGKIICGDEYATRKVKTADLASAVRKLVDKLGTLLASSPW